MRDVTHQPHRTSAPQTVNAESHGTVHEIVGRCNGIEHLTNLLGLMAGITGVGVNLFNLHFFRGWKGGWEL